jgi:hypothetical protein
MEMAHEPSHGDTDGEKVSKDKKKGIEKNTEKCSEIDQSDACRGGIECISIDKSRGQESDRGNICSEERKHRPRREASRQEKRFEQEKRGFANVGR